MNRTGDVAHQLGGIYDIEKFQYVAELLPPYLLPNSSNPSSEG